MSCVFCSFVAKLDEGKGEEQGCEEHGRCAGQRAVGATEENGEEGKGHRISRRNFRHNKNLAFKFSGLDCKSGLTALTGAGT